jgi:hypothetical protein
VLPFARRTGFFPCVIIAILGLLQFFFGNCVILSAISIRSSVSKPCSFANAAASYATEQPYLKLEWKIV